MFNWQTMASSGINMDGGVENLTPVEAPGPDSMTKTPSSLSELGISTQSFIPSSNCKDKSRWAQLKKRRRSNIGARGSPETNSLIRYQAQQRMKTPPATPEFSRARPSLPNFSSTLKQKMASFQSLMDVEENDMLETDNLKENSIPESCPPPIAAPPTKRRCSGLFRECAEEIREANTPILKHTPLKPHEVAVLQDSGQLAQPVTPRAPVEKEPGHAVFLSPHQPAVYRVPVRELQPSPLTRCTPTKEQQEHSFELQSPGQAQTIDSRPCRPAEPPLFLMPSLLELNSTDGVDPSGNSTRKQKHVRFGAALSPEMFDNNLPPDTPLHRGATPARALTSTGGSQLRSLLKTPQRSEPRSTLTQPDFSSPSLSGASPPLSMGPRGSMALGGGDGTLEKIAFPTLEDIDSSLMDNTDTAAEVNLETQPLDLNAAFQDDSITEALLDPAPETESVSEPALALEPEPEDVCTAAPASDPAPSAAPASAPAPSATPASAPAPSATPASAPARSASRKRKQPEEEEPVRRKSTRIAASPASGKKEHSFELQSPGQAQTIDSRPCRPAEPPLFLMPSLLELNSTDGVDPSGNSTRKQKHVRFGAALSPEMFDNNLPPDTPLHRGATPARALTSTGGSQLRSLLKTPQRSEPRSTLTQPDFSSPSLSGASPPLSMGPRGSMALGGGDGTLEKIAFPTLEDIDSSLMDNTDTAAEVNLETQPLDLNAAFQDDSITEALLVDPAPETESVSEPALALEPEPEDVCTAAPASDPAPSAAPASAPAPSATPASAPAPSATPASAPARSASRKRKQPEGEEPVRRKSTRIAASPASGKKKALAKRGWSKEVDRSLYPSREYASKNPLLSPLTETLSSASHSPTPEPCQTQRGTAKEEASAPLLSVESVIRGDPVTGVAAPLRRRCSSTNDNPADTLGPTDTSASDPCDGASEAPVDPSTDTTVRTGRKRSGSGPRTPSAKIQSRGRPRKVAVPSEDGLSEEPEQTEDQMTIPEVTVTGPPQHAVNGECASAAVDDQHTETPADQDTSREADGPTTACPPSDVEPQQQSVRHVKSKMASKGRSRGAKGRSIGRVSAIAEDYAVQTKVLPPGDELEGREQQHAASREEEQDGQHRLEEPDPCLAPWQQMEFRIEDVLRAPAAGRRSVRRSLRNQRSQEDGEGSGLAWQPRTSPDSISVVRRRSRGSLGPRRRSQTTWA